jgi:anaphase-promoting complex subunit 2
MRQLGRSGERSFCCCSSAAAAADVCWLLVVQCLNGVLHAFDSCYGDGILTATAGLADMPLDAELSHMRLPIQAMLLMFAGLLLDIVSEPIRAYLRSRPDTIRCIVSMLTEDNNDSNSGSGSSLLQELQAQQQQGNAGAGIASSGSGAGFGFGPGGLTAAVAPPSAVAALSNAGSGKAGARVLLNWCVSEAEGDDAALRLLEALQAAPPDATATAAAGPGSGGPAAAGSGTPAGGENAKRPAAAAAASELEHAAGLLGLPQTRSAAAAAASSALLSGGHVAADVVSMLIGIYGGPLLFMEEYRLMLADRLLAKDEYDCQREIMTLELLKIR